MQACNCNTLHRPEVLRLGAYCGFLGLRGFVPSLRWRCAILSPRCFKPGQVDLGGDGSTNAAGAPPRRPRPPPPQETCAGGSSGDQGLAEAASRPAGATYGSSSSRRAPLRPPRLRPGGRRSNRSRENDAFIRAIVRAISEDLKPRFDSIDSRFDRVDSRFDGVDSRFDGVDSRFDGVDSRFDGVDSRFDGVDSRFDGVDSRFNGVDSRLDASEEVASANSRQLDQTAQTVGVLAEQLAVTALKRTFPGPWLAQVVISRLGDVLELLEAVPEFGEGGSRENIQKAVVTDLMARGLTAFLLVEVAAARLLLAQDIRKGGAGPAEENAAAADEVLADVFADLAEPLRASEPPEPALVHRVRSALGRGAEAHGTFATTKRGRQGPKGGGMGSTAAADGDGTSGGDVSLITSELVLGALKRWAEAKDDAARRELLVADDVISMLVLSARQHFEALRALDFTDGWEDRTPWLRGAAVQRLELGAFAIAEAAGAEGKFVARIVNIETRARLTEAAQRVERFATILAYVVNTARAAGLVKSVVDLRGCVLVFQTEEAARFKAPKGDSPPKAPAHEPAHESEPALQQAFELDFYKVQGYELLELEPPPLV